MEDLCNQQRLIMIADHNSKLFHRRGETLSRVHVTLVNGPGLVRVHVCHERAHHDTDRNVEAKSSELLSPSAHKYMASLPRQRKEPTSVQTTEMGEPPTPLQRKFEERRPTLLSYDYLSDR